jgi:hypothetical protein
VSGARLGGAGGCDPRIKPAPRVGRVRPSARLGSGVRQGGGAERSESSATWEEALLTGLGR